MWCAASRGVLARFIGPNQKSELNFNQDKIEPPTTKWNSKKVHDALLVFGIFHLIVYFVCNFTAILPTSMFAYICVILE